MHSYYQTTLALTGTRSATSRTESATDWDFTANSAGVVTGVYERVKVTYKMTFETHPRSNLSSYEETYTDLAFALPGGIPSYPASGQTIFRNGLSTRTTDATRRSSTFSSFGSTTLAGQGAVTESFLDTPSAFVATYTVPMAYTSASVAVNVSAVTTSSSEDTVSGITGTVVNSVATTTATLRTVRRDHTVSTLTTRSTRATAHTSAIVTTSGFPVAFITILEAEPHERGFLMTTTEYSQGYVDNLADSFTKTTLTPTFLTVTQEPVLSTAEFFSPTGVRTTRVPIALTTTVSSLATITRYSADGWWPMSATMTEQLTRITTSETTVSLDTTSVLAAPATYAFTFDQTTAYTTIHTTETLVFSIHTNSANNGGGPATAHRHYQTVVTIHTDFPVLGPASTIGTSTSGTGTYNSYSTWVDFNGRTSLVAATSSSTHSVSGLTAATSSTQFNPSWSELGTLQTSREDYYTSTSLLSSLSSTSTDAIYVTYTTIFGQSTEHYQTTRDIRSSRSTTSESGFSTYAITSSATDTCNLPPDTITASGITSGALTTSATYSTLIHNAAVTASQLYTSSSQTTFTDTCAVAPGLSTSSGRSFVSGLYASETYRSIYHDAVLIPSSSSFSASSRTDIEYCFDYPPGTETRSGQTTNSTLTSQTYASFSHDPFVTNSSSSLGTTESTVTETCNVLPTTYTASGATTYYDFFGRSETQSSTFATTIHNAATVSFDISYATTSTSFTEACGISNSLEESSTVSTADNGLTAHTIITYRATMHSAPNPHTVTQQTYGTWVTYATTYGTHTLSSLTSVITITNSSSAGNNHLVTYSTSVTLSTVGTTYGTHTVTDETYYSSTVPSSVGFGTHTLSYETRVTTTYSSSDQTTSLFTSPELSYVSSSASYSETTITTTQTLSVSVNSSLVSVVSVTLGSTAFTEIQGLTFTDILRLPSFANATSTDTINVVAPNGIFFYIGERFTREYADGGVSPVSSWGPAADNLVPSGSLSLYFPEIARGQRRPSYTDFYRLSLAAGSSTYSSGASRTTVSYLSGDVISVSSMRTTFGSTSRTNTFEGTVSFSLSGTTGYYAPILENVAPTLTGTNHFGGLPANGDGVGSVQLIPRVYQFTSQINGTSTGEVTTWLQSISTFSNSAYGLKFDASGTEAIRFCSFSSYYFGTAHLATFTLPMYYKGFSTDSTAG
jgi:hypothetical protein